MKITVAIPCYRSAKTIQVVVDRIRETIAQRPGYEYQIVLVNDCSPDNTMEVIREICSYDVNVIGVDLSKNQGQPNARMAAFPFIDGDIAVFMDDDGQHPVERMFELTDKIEEGYDLVTADFRKKEESFFRRISSRMASAAYTAMGKRPQGAVSSSFFAINRMCVEKVKEYTSPFPALFGYLYQFCGRITSIPMEENKRITGRSGYTFKKRMKVFLNGFINFTLFPIKAISFLGTVSVGASILLALTALILKLVKVVYSGTALLTCIMILFMGGIILLSLGILGEFIGRSFMILAGQPQYVIRETINSKRNDASHLE